MFRLFIPMLFRMEFHVPFVVGQITSVDMLKSKRSLLLYLELPFEFYYFSSEQHIL